MAGRHAQASTALFQHSATHYDSQHDIYMMMRIIICLISDYLFSAMQRRRHFYIIIYFARAPVMPLVDDAPSILRAMASIFTFHFSRHSQELMHFVVLAC